MTTVPHVPTGADKVDDSSLAINGGPKAVSADGRDRWKHIRLRDAIPIAKRIHWGITTSPGDAFVEFEQEFAELTGCKFGLAMNSGTAALHSALFAVGVGPGDEVVLPSYTYHATASAVLCCGATPVFCDIDPRTLTADPADIQRRVGPRTKAIMVVHVWGNPAEMDAIQQVAQQHKVAIVEDCSHAHGAAYQDKPIGSWGDVGCFSLQGFKAVSAGEGGIAVCSDPRYVDRMQALGQPVRLSSGSKVEQYDLGTANVGPKYRPHLFGVLLAQSSLQRLPELNRLRSRSWELLCSELADCEQLRPVETLQGSQRGGFLEFKFILGEGALRVPREEFLKAVCAEGAPASADRYGFLHDMPVFRKLHPITVDSLLNPTADLSPRCELPCTDSLRDRIVTLPAFTDVSETFLKQVATAIKKVSRAFAADCSQPNAS